MNTRQSRLLMAIIDEFINTALPVGSKQIVEQGHFDVSGATIRNEMQILSEEGFIEQPHISAGRIPTAKGYRMYVREFMQPSLQERAVRRRFTVLKDQYLRQKDQERVYEAVALLAKMMCNVAFATVPHKDHVYYLGLANALKQPEFREDPALASGIVEILETPLADLLSRIPIDETVRYYIGDEDILANIHSCSMIVKRYRVGGEEGCVGILGPIRMDYGYNTVALELVSELLKSER
ncbi:hypothetical protein HYZ98_04770 [Candidatus Peregrinibacteria bacterium]|nr:hypothetical protein [Candidatus Peregrinibacteria bacterium]